LVGKQGIGERPERAAPLDSTPHQRGHPRRARPSHLFREQTALPHAGLAREQHDTAVALYGIGQAPIQVRDLARPRHQDAGPQVLRHVVI
jgi:hypothetical protein